MSNKAKASLVPKLRFPEYRGTREWEVRVLSSFSKVGDIDHKMPSSVIDGIPYIMTGDFFGINGIDFENAKKVSVEDYEQLAKKIKPEFGDIVIARYASVGAVRYIETKSKFLVSYSCAIVKCNRYEDSKYLYYILQSDVIQSKIGLEVNASSQKNIGIDSIKKLNIFLPTLPEQQKIAKCLNSLDELIAAQARKVDELKTHKKGLMQQLFPHEGETQPRLRFPEFRGGEAWSVGKLGNIAENLDNRRVPITSSDREVGDIPYYGASGIVDYVKDFIFDEDLLCISEDGANLVARTYPIAFPITGKTWVNNHAHVLRFANACTQKFVEVYLNSIKLDDFITGMAQPKLNKAMLDSIPISRPDIPEQQRIADCLTSLDNLITAATQELESLKTHKKGLMKQLFPVLEGGRR